MTRLPYGQGCVPAEVMLPFDYKVTVLRVPVDGNAWGDWDPDTRTIRVDKTLRQYAQARYIFLHEMEHAWKDWLKYVATKVGIESPDGPVDEPAGLEEPE